MPRYYGSFFFVFRMRFTVLGMTRTTMANGDFLHSQAEVSVHNISDPLSHCNYVTDLTLFVASTAYADAHPDWAGASRADAAEVEGRRYVLRVRHAPLRYTRAGAPRSEVEMRGIAAAADAAFGMVFALPALLAAVDAYVARDPERVEELVDTRDALRVMAALADPADALGDEPVFPANHRPHCFVDESEIAEPYPYFEFDEGPRGGIYAPGPADQYPYFELDEQLRDGVYASGPAEPYVEFEFDEGPRDGIYGPGPAEPYFEFDEGPRDGIYASRSDLDDPVA